MTFMTTIDAKQFGEICEGVWNERAAVLRGCGRLSGEATLARAVFWRLCKAGIETNGDAHHDSSPSATGSYQLVIGQMLETHARPAFDSAPILKELLDRYQNESSSS
jgi:hypothetical protein